MCAVLMGSGMGEAQCAAEAEGVPLGTCRANQQCQPPCSAPRLVTNAQLRAVVTTLVAVKDRLCVSLQACVQTFI